ncbi:MAG: hypothetical protein AB1728_11990 [Bacteroidota bacterium]
MNPESRIKLIQSLGEVRYFHNINFESRYWKISAWGGILFYLVLTLGYFISHTDNKFISLLFLLLPIPVSSMWLLLRYQLDEKYKLLANAILEIGNVSENYLSQTQIQSSAIAPAATRRIKKTKQVRKRVK